MEGVTKGRGNRNQCGETGMIGEYRRCCPGYLALVTVLLLFLAGCGARVDQTVTFFDDEGWEADVRITLPQEVIAFAAQAQLDAEIANLARDLEAAGAKVSYKVEQEEGLITYIIDAKGSGLDILRQVAFDGADIQMQLVDGQEQIFFRMNVPYDLAGGTITLIGDEVIDSNGRIIDDGKVQWVNASGRIEAVMVPKSRFGGQALLLPLGLAAAFVGLVAVGVRRSRSQPTAAAPPPLVAPAQPAAPAPALPQPSLPVQVSPARYCGHCGAPMGSEARFCPACGQPTKRIEGER